MQLIPVLLISRARWCASASQHATKQQSTVYVLLVALCTDAQFLDAFLHSSRFVRCALCRAATTSGYSVGMIGVNGQAPLSKIWSVTVPGEVLALQPRTPSPATAHVKVQGDRSMRFRYLNPNMVLIVSGTTSPGALS
jgi:hypothetical protein